MRCSLTPYRAEHRPACLSIFDGNLPEYVAAHERDDFATFLDRASCPYFVVQDDLGELVACGGYGLEPDRARLCWGLVRRDHHRRGIGRFLLIARLVRILDQAGPVQVAMDTSQKTSAFFERFGFKVTERIPDGYWPGLDKLEMSLMLDGQAIGQFRIDSRIVAVTAFDLPGADN